MTWVELFQGEVRMLHAQEEDVVPTLERLRARADGAATHEILLQMVEAAPARQGRLTVVCSLAGWTPERRTAAVIEGWQRDVDAIVDHRPKDVVLDAAILSLVLRIARLRTAGYEAAFLLAKNLDAHVLANLLAPIWAEDRESDERTSNVLATLIGSGGADWDESFRLSQSG